MTTSIYSSYDSNSELELTTSNDPRNEIFEPEYGVRFAEIEDEGAVVGFAISFAKEISPRTKQLMASVFGKPTAGYWGDGFYVGFWRLTHPHPVDDGGFYALWSAIREIAAADQIDLEVADWEPSSAISDLLYRNGPEYDLGARIAILKKALADVPQPEEIEAAQSAIPTDKVVGETKSDGYTRIPNAVLDDATLTIGARLAYGLLLRHAYGKDYCFPSQQRLAILMGMSERSLRDYLRELEKAGLVKTERQDRTRHNRYCLQRVVTTNAEPNLRSRRDDRKR